MLRINNKTILISVTTLAMIFIAVCFGLSNFQTPEKPERLDLDQETYVIENKQIFDGSKIINSENTTESTKVLDCREGGCEETVLNTTYKYCSETYSNYSLDDCQKSQKGLEKVNFISDPQNHITAPITEENYTVEATIEPIETVDTWDIQFVDENHYFITELNGKIREYKNDDLKAEYNLDVYDEGLRSGLMGLEISKNFEEDRTVYVYYSRSEGVIEEEQIVNNRVSEIRLFSENGSIEDEERITSDIPGGGWHHGGRLLRIDEYLYITTGDAEKFPEKAQDDDFLGGKILRKNLNQSQDIEIYSKGLRNPQGISKNPETEEITISQHGPWRRDEIRNVEENKSYPWPSSCNFSDPENRYDDQPLFCTQTWTLAPSGVTFVDDKNHEWYGDLFLSSLRGNHLHRFEFDNATLTNNEIFWTTGMERNRTYGTDRVRDVEFKNGKLWILGDHGEVVNIEPNNKQHGGVQY